MADLSITAAISDDDRAAIVRDVATELERILGDRQSLLVDGDVMAKMLGISRPHLDRLRVLGTVPSVTLGRSRRYHPNAVVVALQQQEASNGERLT